MDVILLPDPQWSLWRWVGLRGAGFPVSKVLTLSMPGCAAAADMLISAEAHSETLWQEAIDCLSNRIAKATEPDRSLLIKALRLVRKGKIPTATLPDSEGAQCVKRFASAFERVDQAWQEYEKRYEEALERTSGAIDEIARDERFREAIVWQNHEVLHSGIEVLLEKRKKGTRDSRVRKLEEMVATYWQRYCTKNDTIGFFGPVGWCTLSDENEMITVQPGRGLLARRTVYFDGWCIDAIARALSKDHRIRKWIAPTLSPSICIEDRTVHLPGNRQRHLSRQEAAVLNACDGITTARTISRSLLADESLELGPADVYAILDNFSTSSLIEWDLAVPWVSDEKRLEWRLERRLRRLLDRIEDAEIRDTAIEAVTRLEAQLNAIAAAAGRPADLDAAIHALESAFSAITGSAPSRAGGRMYAGRTLVYEDCVRDIKVQIGRPLIDEINHPLNLILTAARWYASEVASRCIAEFDEIYDRMAIEEGTRAIQFSNFWARVQAVIFGERSSLTDSALQSLQHRWSAILSFPADRRSVSYSSRALRDAVSAAFPSGGTSWPGARYYSPDLMIAAQGVDAIRRGDFQLVLGECHVASNTLDKMVFVAQHPSQQELFDAVAADWPEPRVVPTAPKFLITPRTYSVLASRKDFRLEFALDSAGTGLSPSISAGTLMVERLNKQLVVRTRDDKNRFEILEVFSEVLSERTANGFRILFADEHTPRITIDRLVVCRESWNIPAGSLEFAFEKSEPLRFVYARKWARSAGLPRFVFFKTSAEVKPCFLDFDSPVLVNVFARYVRRSAELQGDHVVSISEMLPTPEQVWLPDSEGRLYTCELRMVAVSAAAGGAAA